MSTQSLLPKVVQDLALPVGQVAVAAKINNLQRVYLSIPFQIKILTLPDTGNGSPSSRDTGLTGYQLSPKLSVLFSSNIVASACAGMLLKSLGSEIRLTL